ncbi:MAG: ABC transporter permease [Oligoflexales bacterium]|nr:ABC transporter permease [Oligoflexales bacterium]
MHFLRYTVRKILYGIPLILGVTFISFLLMVYFGPEQTYTLLGKNPTPEDLENIRRQLGYDLPFITRYAQYLQEIFTFDFGYSASSNERVLDILARTVPVSIMVSIPGFLLGNGVGICLALCAAHFRGLWPDKLIMFFSVFGMSVSLLIVIIGFQMIFCSSYGLNWFPVQGWDVDSFFDYLKYVTVPTMATSFVAIGYNTRFFRSVLVEEIDSDHVRTMKAFGIHPLIIIIVHVLQNNLIPILTRMIFTIPYILIGGSILIESFFAIPGVGGVTYDAISSGDLPIMKAVISIYTLLYVGVLIATDLVYRLVDPRVELG